MVPVIAIFDIGKTNKKFFLFNENYKIVEALSVNFPETEDEDGFPCDDVLALSEWVIDTLKAFTSGAVYDIKAINFSAYGASFVHLDQYNSPIAPLYNYLKPYDPALEEKFYNSYGAKDSLAVSTASPSLGNLNSGLQLYALKYSKPALYEKITTSLHLPQYLSFLVSGKKYSDITSIGCHTALWDFDKKNYHAWVEQEGIDKKLAPIFSSTAAIDIMFDGKPLKCGIGLHDSSAAFIPYIKNINEPFLLISTGTWSISMNAYNNAPLTKEELERDCLCYMTFEGGTVKSSRLFAGYAHEQVTKKMAAHFNVASNYYDKIAYDHNLLREEPELATLDAFEPGGYSSYEEAYLNFIQHLVDAQKRSTDLVLNDQVKNIFVDGGFAKNEAYMQLLAKAYPQVKVYAASVSQATAIGAAMAIHKEWNPLQLPGNVVSKKAY